MGSERKPDRELPLAETLAGPEVLHTSGATLPASQRDIAAAAAIPPDALANGAVIDDRYVVDRVIGRGGMGVVYLARDNSLGRDVALKLHRAGSGHDRLYREAVAMAQLAHPNVVTVFEVGVVDDQLFVAMEYIRGATLRGWWGAARRSWRDIVTLLLDVGAGLAAAHRAGLVHRDFKPENVLVGDDGRPRVSDFGLARANVAVTASLPPTVTPRDRRATPAQTPIPTTGPMTETGSILGTPAYMSPEQHAGTEVDPRSDQFAFCVAAWEALYGKRPFHGATTAQLQQAIERGEIAVPDDNAVPASVDRVLRRGLAARAAERWPDMATLLVALRRTLHRRTARWLAIGGVVAAAAAGAGAFALASAADQAPSCAGAGSDVAAMLPGDLRARIVERAGEIGPEAARRAEHALDGLSTGYRDTAVFACRAAGKRDWSADLAERSRSCLVEQAKAAVAELRVALESFRDPNKIVVETAEITGAADFEACRDPNALLARPVRAIAQSAAISDARAELAGARVLAAGGDTTHAKAVLARVLASPVGSAVGVIAPVAAARAAIANASEHPDEAIRELTNSYYAAHAEGDLPNEIQALQLLLYWLGAQRQDNAAAEPWYRLALSEIDRFSRALPLDAAKLRTALIGVAVLRNELPVAVEQGRLAAEALVHGPPLARAAATREYANALAESGDLQHSLTYSEIAAQQIGDAFGSDAFELAPIYADEALTLTDAGRQKDAVDVAEHAMALVEHHPDKTLETANVELNLAAVLINANDGDRAEHLLLTARATYVERLGDANPTLATIDGNLALIQSDRGKFGDAAALLRRSLALREKALGPDHPDVAATLYNLATALRDSGDLAGALDAAHRCVEIRGKVLATSDMYVYALLLQAQLENKLGRHEAALRDASTASEVAAPRADFQVAAWTQLEQATSLVALHRDLPNARRLLDLARATYAAHDMTPRVTEIDALLARIR